MDGAVQRQAFVGRKEPVQVHDQQEAVRQPHHAGQQADPGKHGVGFDNLLRRGLLQAVHLVRRQDQGAGSRAGDDETVIRVHVALRQAQAGGG